ncbi:lipid A export permease/ATP-binding protein MsbA [Kushneria aurantia]|uniref:Lipid A export permease/ATP-binding protein MsbA n=1 Tax=Kushneria aurantia TaxID=504092 RepID=A0ABV6G8S2_9GAMM|nr:lipid A export permease/ATP-binding protein MsbA [Kushneria aurantia]
MNPNASLTLYRRLLGYVRPFWKAFVIALIGNAIYAGSSTLLARVMQFLTDGLQNPDAAFRQLLPLMLIGIFIARGIGTFMGSYGMQYVARNVVHSLRINVFRQMLHLPGRFYDEHSGGHLISRVTYHVEQVTGAATKALNVVLQEGMLVIGLTLYLFWTNWKLMLIFMAVTPLIAAIVGWCGKRFRKLSRRIQRSVGEVTHVASETISGYRVVRTHGAERYEYDRFVRASDDNRVQSLKEALTKSISAPVIQTLVAMSLALLVWLALAPELLGNMTAGEFIGFITAATMMIKPIKSLTEINGLIQKGLAASQELFELIDRPQEPDNGHHDPGRVAGDVNFEAVRFYYDAHQPDVLSGISHRVQAGEMIALVGRSGSGKSTLMNLLPRFYDPTGGRITIDGVEIRDYTLQALRRQIALVTQNVTLFNASVADNIAYGIDNAPRDRVREAARAAYADGFIERLPNGFDTVVGDNGVMLSGGQRQRIAIARAIFRDAPILVLDEATSALDTESERYIQRALEEVCQGRTTFVIAHRLSTIERADRILVMDGGEIIEAGDHQSLLHRGGAYAALHRLQFSEDERHEPVREA